MSGSPKPGDRAVVVLPAGAAEPPPAAAAASGSWAALPHELLLAIFSHLLPPNVCPGALMYVAEAWLLLRLTCHSWAAALDEAPVAVAACIPLPAMLPWLQRHATALLLHQEPAGGFEKWAERHDPEAVAAAAAAAGDGPNPAPWQAPGSGCFAAASGPGPAHWPGPITWLAAGCWPRRRGAALRPAASRRQTVSLFGVKVDALSEYETWMYRLAAGDALMGGQSYGYTQRWSYRFQHASLGPTNVPSPLLDLIALRRLQVLDIRCSPNLEPTGEYGGIMVHFFDTRPLSCLPRLRELSLENFEEPCLAGLPPSLRRLHIKGGQRSYVSRNECPLGCPQRMFAVPAHCRLDQVCLLGYNEEAKRPPEEEEQELDDEWEGYDSEADECELPDPLSIAESLRDWQWIFAVHLSNHACHTRRLHTDAYALFLGQPFRTPAEAALRDSLAMWEEEQRGSAGSDEAAERRRDRSLLLMSTDIAYAEGRPQAVRSDVEGAVQALAAHLGGPGEQLLERLRISSHALLVLPKPPAEPRGWGPVDVWPVALLDSVEGRRLLRERCRGAQLEADGAGWLELRWNACRA
ncbi:hypothetical protein ABPG75_008494 [Micractinium tetrahymenae]